MSRDNVLLELEIRLLLARHGRRRVLQALSTISDLDLTTLETEVKAYGGRPKEGEPKRHRRSIKEIVEAANPAGKEAKHLSEKLALAYENREFLPELREVKRLLESRGAPPATIRSRADALPTVLSVLARYGTDDLRRLTDERRGRGDLGIIADQILGHGRTSGESN